MQYADKITRAADALISEALEQTVPAAWRVVVQAAYRAGYELGREEAAFDADAAADEAFNDGWDMGYEHGEAVADDAYCQGVADARARPETADERAAYLSEKSLLDAAEYQLDLFDEEYPVGCGGPTATSAGTRTAARTDEP